MARAVTRWLQQAGVNALFIAKGSPWESGCVESFNSRLRDELLNREVFTGLEDARWVVDRWRLDYNHYRPHSSLDYQTPAAYAARWLPSAPQVTSATPQRATGAGHTNTLEVTQLLESHRGQVTLLAASRCRDVDLFHVQHDTDLTLHGEHRGRVGFLHFDTSSLNVSY